MRAPVPLAQTQPSVALGMPQYVVSLLFLAFAHAASSLALFRDANPSSPWIASAWLSIVFAGTSALFAGLGAAIRHEGCVRGAALLGAASGIQNFSAHYTFCVHVPSADSRIAAVCVLVMCLFSFGVAAWPFTRRLGKEG